MSALVNRRKGRSVTPRPVWSADLFAGTVVSTVHMPYSLLNVGNLERFSGVETDGV